jgi:hypothetical protein
LNKEYENLYYLKTGPNFKMYSPEGKKDILKAIKIWKSNISEQKQHIKELKKFI